MNKLIKFGAILIFLLGSALAVNAFSPAASAKIKEAVLSGLSKFKTKPLADKAVNTVSPEPASVLGENIDQEIKNFGEDIASQVSQLPQKIISQEIVSEATETVNKIIIEKIEETKSLPSEEVKKIENNIRSQIYQQICKEWLKE